MRHKVSEKKIFKVSKVAKIRNRYNQVPHLTQDTNGKVTNSQKTPQTRAKRSALSQQSMENLDPQGGAILDPRGLIGRIYVPHGFREEGLLKVYKV